MKKIYLLLLATTLSLWNLNAQNSNPGLPSMQSATSASSDSKPAATEKTSPLQSDAADPTLKKLYAPGRPYSTFNADKEDLAKRTEDAKHFKNDDGSYSAALSSGPSHYWENGGWRTLSNDITPSGDALFPFAALHTSTKTWFGNNLSNGIKIVKPGNITFNRFSPQSIIALDAAGNQMSLIQSANEGAPLVTDGENPENVKYTNVYPNTDFTILNQSDFIKTAYKINHNIFTSLPHGTKQVAFIEKIRIPDGATVERKISESNGHAFIEVILNGKAILAYKNALYFEDTVNRAMNKIKGGTANLDYTLSGNDLELQMSVPAEWLTAADTKYPVTIDPTINYTANNAAWWTGTATDYCEWDNNVIAVGYIDFDVVACDSWIGGVFGQDFTCDKRYFEGFAKFNLTSLPPTACYNDADLFMHQDSYHDNDDNRNKWSIGQAFFEPVIAGGCTGRDYVNAISNSPTDPNSFAHWDVSGWGATWSIQTSDYCEQCPGWHGNGVYPSMLNVEPGAGNLGGHYAYNRTKLYNNLWLQRSTGVADAWGNYYMTIGLNCWDRGGASTFDDAFSYGVFAGYASGNRPILQVNYNSPTGSLLSDPIVGVNPVSCTPYTNTQSNVVANCFGNDVPSPVSGNSSHDIWYSFYVSGTQSVDISTCASTLADTYVSLWSGTTSANLAYIASNDNNGPLCTGNRASLRQTLNTGWHLVAVEGAGANAGSISLSIALSPAILGTVSNLGPINFCGVTPTGYCDFSPAVTVSGYAGNPVWEFATSAAPSSWNTPWVPGASSGTSCFPPKVALSDANPDRIRVGVTACATTVYSPTIELRNRFNSAPTGPVTAISGACLSGFTITSTFAGPINILGTVDFYRSPLNTNFGSNCSSGTLIASVQGNGTTSVSTFTIPPGVGTYYYGARYNPGITTGGCSPSFCTPATAITILANPDPPTAAGATNPLPGTVCGGSTVTVSGVPTGGVNPGASCGYDFQYSTNTGASWTGPYSGTSFTQTGTGSSGASTITVASGAGIVAGQLVTGIGLGANAIVAGSYVSGSTSVPLTAANLASVSGTLTFTTYNLPIVTPSVTGTNNVIVQARRANCNGQCPVSAWGTIATWSTVLPPSSPTTAVKNPNVAAICAGSTLTLAGPATGGSAGVGCVINYQYSNNGGSTWTSTGTLIPSFAGQYISGTFTVNSIQAWRDCAGSCGYTTPVTIASWNVYPIPTSPTGATTVPTSGSTVCSGSIISGLPTGGIDAACSFDYQYSTDGGANYTLTTTPSFVAAVGINNNILQARRINCASGCSNTAFVTIGTWSATAGFSGTITATPNVTYGCAGTLLSITAINDGTNPCTWDYQYSTDGGTTWTYYYDANPAIFPSFNAVAGTNILQARRINCVGCPGYQSNWQTVYSWTVTPIPAGAVFATPIDLNDLTCSGFSDVQNNSPSNCFGNDYGSASDDIYYTFHTTAAGAVSISTCGSGVDTRVYLLDNTGALLEGDDNNDDNITGTSCSSTESYFEYTVAANTDYYVVVEGFGLTDYGDINTQINVLAPIGGITGDTAFCYGETKTYSITGSAPYTWAVTSVPSGTATISAGQGTANITVTFGAATAATITCEQSVYSGCTINAVYPVSIKAIPQTLSGTGSYCAASSATISLSSTEPRVRYDLYRIGSASILASILTGQYPSTSFGYTPSFFDTYYVIARPAGAQYSCEYQFLSEAIVQNGNPTVYTLTIPVNSVCPDPGLVFHLDGSQDDVSYQLLQQGTAYGTPLTPGASAGFDFNPVNTPLSTSDVSLSYTVRATNTISGCLSTTSPGVSGTLKGVPSTALGFTSSGSQGPFCDNSIRNLRLAAAPNGVVYDLYKDGSPAAGACQMTGRNNQNQNFKAQVAVAVTGVSTAGGNVTLTFIYKHLTRPSHPFIVGSSITVAGISVGGYNGTYTVTATTYNTTTGVASITYVNATTGAATGGTITGCPLGIATTAATGAAGIATLTFATQTQIPFAVGTWIYVVGVNSIAAGYNSTIGSGVVVTAATTSSVSYANATTAAQTTSGLIYPYTPDYSTSVPTGITPGTTSSTAVTGITAPGVITAALGTTNNWYRGMPVVFGGTVGTLTPGNTYYINTIVSATGTTFTVSASQYGAQATSGNTTVTSGTVTSSANKSQWGTGSATVNSTVATNQLILSAGSTNGWARGMPIAFDKAIASGIVANTVYYVQTILSATNFTVSAIANNSTAVVVTGGLSALNTDATSASATYPTTTTA
ncbi:MAG: hypothetical protein V4615_03870, partial [Bacteroidota bacterium]